MQFSYALLGELVDLDGLTPAKIAARLTFAGFEVEGVSPATQASAVVSGRIAECVPHPDSDHLHVLKVELGPALGTKQIVCGAPNAKAGMNVIVALPGCVLPALGTTIKKGTIRGVASDGMCCALSELGLPREVLPESETLGIHDLGPDYAPGDTAVLANLGLADTLLDVNVLPNRPDCLSYLGLARELSALTGRKLVPTATVALTALPARIKPAIATRACARFALLGAEAKGPVDAPTAAELQRWLWLSGLHTVSPLVDLGNFVMLLTGQPFHIYDRAQAPTDTLTARTDYRGPFAALDGKTYQLAADDIVIADGRNQPLCLGGIMGGAKPMVTAATTDIAVESACFYHVNIRHTAARLGLASAAASLFAKGVNPRGAVRSLEIFAGWLKKLYPAAALYSFAVAGAEPAENRPFPFALARLNHRLGGAYTAAEVDRVLKAYGVAEAAPGQLVAPWWRVDLNEQADIDEEVFRYYPAARIPLSYDGLPLTEGGLTRPQRLVKTIRSALEGLGLSEILTFTLVDAKQSQAIRVFDAGACYRIKNPLTKDHEYVRVDLLPSMVEALARNIARRQEDLAFFEISPVDTPRGNRRYLALGLNGQCHDQELYRSRPYDFFDLKRAVVTVLDLLGIAANRVAFRPSANPSFHPGKAADLWLGKTLLGTFGALNPAAFAAEYLVGELDLAALLAIKTGKTRFAPFTSFPAVRRDLSLQLDGPVSYEAIVKVVRKASQGLLRDVALFDSYTAAETGRRSVGLALYLGAADRTLKDSETEAEVAAVKTALVAALPVSVDA